MTKEDLDALVQQVNTTGVPVKTTPREIIDAFGYEKRSYYCIKSVDNYFREKEVLTAPDYNEIASDSELYIQRKERACRADEFGGDPIKRISLMKCSSKKPTCATEEMPLAEAENLMQLNDYSQLPVVANKSGAIRGYISWKTIKEKQLMGCKSTIVKDYMVSPCMSVSLHTPLLQIFDILRRQEFVVVTKTNTSNEPCGIVTLFDILEQFITWTKPFVILDEIENQVRNLFDNDKVLLEEMQSVCKDDKENAIIELLTNASVKSDIIENAKTIFARTERKVHSIDDLNFGEYIRLMDDARIWDKLQKEDAPLPSSTFISQLNKVRRVRNDVMHFDPAGISPDQVEMLENVDKFLQMYLEKK